MEENKTTKKQVNVSKPKNKVSKKKKTYQRQAYVKNKAATVRNKKLDETNLEEVGNNVVLDKLAGLGEDDSISKNQKFFKKLFSIIFIVLVIGVLAWTFYNDFFASDEKISWGEVATVLSETWFYIIFAFVSLFFCFFLKGFKMSFLCKSLTGKFHFKTCLQTAIIGHYFNYVTPLAVGGQPFEIYHLSKHGVGGGVGASLPIATFFMNQIAFVVLVIISICLLPLSREAGGESAYFTSFLPSVINVLAIIGACCCLIVPSLTFVIAIFPRLGALLIKIVIGLGGKLKIIRDPNKMKFSVLRTVITNSKSLKTTFRRPIITLIVFLISAGEQLAICSIAYFSLRFYGFNIHVSTGFVEWMIVVQLCLILYSAVSFIPTPGNSGAADISFYLMFKWGLETAGTSFPALLTWRILSFYSFIVIGFVYNRIDKKHEQKLKQLSKQI